MSLYSETMVFWYLRAVYLYMKTKVQFFRYLKLYIDRALYPLEYLNLHIKLCCLGQAIIYLQFFLQEN